MSFCTSPIVPAMSAVAVPIAATTASVSGARENSTAFRPIMYTPAVTIVAAWINAETGVGPSIASGSQTCSGICADLPVAPTKSSSVAMVMTPIDVSGARAAAAAATCWKSSVPNVVNTSSMPRMNPKSPIRLTTNAFLPASAADFFRNQNPISRYEQSPTPSHPTKRTGNVEPRTSTSMNDAKRFRYEK